MAQDLVTDGYNEFKPVSIPGDRFAILIASSEQYWELFRISARNKVEYAKRWGCGLFLWKHASPFKPTEKTRFILQALDNMIEPWLWFLGADTMITNMTVDASQFCYPDADFVAGLDYLGVNSDSIFLRRCPATVAFMSAVLAAQEKGAPSDQAAMKRLLRDQTVKDLRVRLVDQHLFNSFTRVTSRGAWKPGEFVAHASGISHPRRMKAMRSLAEQVVR